MKFTKMEKNMISNSDMDRTIKDQTSFSNNIENIFTIANALYDGIYIVDRRGMIIEANKAFIDLIGVQKDELIGKCIKTIWNENIYNVEKAFIASENKNRMPIMIIVSEISNENIRMKNPKAIGLMVLEEKKSVSIITKIARRKKTVIMTGIPFFDEGGEVSFAVTVIRNISESINIKKRFEMFENDKELCIDELKCLKENQSDTDSADKTIGLEDIMNTIKQVAKTDVTVLITGETGVGKEVVAEEIYKNSVRKNNPYIKVNCAAIPEALFESELFGYEKGAFTGAGAQNKLGLFHMANNGTLLLDEIGEMPLKLQVKLLRVLQEKEFTRVGGTSPIKVDVRVIASTNQNLHEQVKKGLFREDLYYRLNVFPIKVLSLRERKEDISILSYYFISEFNKKYNKKKIMQSNAIEVLERYNWPGNVRELKNIIERLIVINDAAIITKEDVIGVLDCGVHSEHQDNENITLKEAVNLLEKNIIEKALKKYGSTYKAAKVLGITQSAVVKKAKALGIKK